MNEIHFQSSIPSTYGIQGLFEFEPESSLSDCSMSVHCFESPDPFDFIDSTVSYFSTDDEGDEVMDLNWDQRCLLDE